VSSGRRDSYFDAGHWAFETHTADIELVRDFISAFSWINGGARVCEQSAVKRQNKRSTNCP
jgi:hypothetical protein